MGCAPHAAAQQFIQAEPASRAGLVQALGLVDQFSRLRDWYAAQCDGDWEHSYGIKLETLDNPGWTLEIDLANTELHERSFSPVHRGDSEEDADWLHCTVSEGKFQAAGGIPNLPDILETFLQWAGR